MLPHNSFWHSEGIQNFFRCLRVCLLDIWLLCFRIMGLFLIVGFFSLLKHTFLIFFTEQIQAIEKVNEFVFPSDAENKLIFWNLWHLVSDYGSGVQLDRLNLKMCVCLSITLPVNNSGRLIPCIVCRRNGFKQVFIGSYTVESSSRLLEFATFHGSFIQGFGKGRRVVFFALRNKIHALVLLYAGDFGQNGTKRFLLILLFFPISRRTLLIFTFLDVYEQLLVVIWEEQAVVLLIKYLHIMSNLFFDRLNTIWLIFNKMGLVIRGLLAWFVSNLASQIIIWSKSTCSVDVVNHRFASIDLLIIPIHFALIC